MSFNGTLEPMLAGFGITALISLSLIYFATPNPITAISRGSEAEATVSN
jgi:hypothetical protein